MNNTVPGMETVLLFFLDLVGNNLFHFVNDGLESCGVVHCKVGKDLTVDFDTGFVYKAHEF